MGKTEKIVVLSVLFAVVVLFVWSLQGPEARAAASWFAGKRCGARGLCNKCLFVCSLFF